MGQNELKRSMLDCLTKAESHFLLEFLYDCVQCNNEDDYLRLFELLKGLTQHEYCTTGIASVNKHGINGNFNVVNIDYPTDWMTLYLEKEFNKIDPVVSSNFSRYQTTFWADLYKEQPPPDDFLSLAEDFSISNGLTSGVRNHMGTKGSLFSFAGDDIEINDRTKLVVSMVVPHLTIALGRILSLRNKIEANISERELEVLKWIALGKSNWETSIILNISERTVEYHLSSIMSKLDATNRTYAVAMALDQGLIDLD